MILTLKMLKDKGACALGLIDFNAVYGDSVEMEWTLENQLLILKTPMRKWIGWAHANKLISLWSMSWANLSGANLSGANLSGANLSGANLSGANLSENQKASILSK